MKKIKDDPLLSIFKSKINGDYIEEIGYIQNIPNFFNFISSDQTPEDSKIGVLENFLQIIKRNRYLCDFFSSYKNKSIYLYLFELFLSKKSSQKLQASITNLLNELILNLETDKETYEYLFQSISKIYNTEETKQEKTPLNLFNHLTLLDVLFNYKEKVSPRNYFSLSGNGKFSLDLKNKKIKIGFCMTFIINFKAGECQKMDKSILFNIKFSNNTSISFILKDQQFLLIQVGKEKEVMLKGLPSNEWINLVINIIIDEKSGLQVFNFVNGENNLSPVKCKNNLNIKNDTIESLDFFENFSGEVTSMTMLIQKVKSNPTVNTKNFLAFFKNFTSGIHKKKRLNVFLNFISEIIPSELTNLQDLITDGSKLDNIIFIFTPFHHFKPSWDNNKGENKSIDDYFGRHKILILDKDNSIWNHRYQQYQKKIYLVCDITNFLPIAEIFLIHPQLLTEQNLELYLQIIGKIINFRKRNVEAIKESSFFKIISLFIEKYPNQIFTEKILDAFINLGKDMFQDNMEQLTNSYFKSILLNEKILSKYSQNLQIKFWNQLFLFCQSDSEQLETFLKMNRICLILRFYDKNKYNEMCCKQHLDMFKNEFSQNCSVMEPSLDKKLIDIWNIINLIIKTQKPKWVLSLFKLLMLDLSPCLAKFIITAIIKAVIIHNDSKKEEKIKDFTLLQSVVFVKGNWLVEFMNEMEENKYEAIIINSFIHSLPDVRLELLKLIYQIYQALVVLDKKNDFKIFFNMMKKYLLPQKMFYNKEGDIETLVLSDEVYKQYLHDIILLFTYWSLDEKLNEIDNEITFEKKNFDQNAVIKNCDIFEIVFDLIKQINYDTDIMSYFFKILLDLAKNHVNCHTILYNYKIFLMLLETIYESYKLKTNSEVKDKNIENCFSLGKTLISTIYLNDILYKENKFITDNYTFNEISLIFLWGDKIMFSNNVNKNKNIKLNVFSYIGELLSEILTEFKLKMVQKIKGLTTSDKNVKQNFVKSYYQENYLIFLNKLFEFSFEYELSLLIKDNKSKSLLPTTDLMNYNSLFLTSMRIDDNKAKSITLYWKDYQFFDEIYSKVSYIWKKDNLYKHLNKEKYNNSNKLKKYEDILEDLILNKDRRNTFIKELKFLCCFYVEEKEYDIYGESKDKNSFVDILKNNKLNISFIKMIQIPLVSMISLIMAKQDETEVLKWIKELKQFVVFLIIASSNVIINEKDKEPNESKFFSYIYLQEQCLYAIYICLHSLYQIRIISNICKKKIDKTCVSVFLLCFVILRNVYNYRKKNKISKKFAIGYKYNINDLSGSSIFTLFNEYIKDKSKEKGDNTFLTLDKLNTLLEENKYFDNIIKLLDDKNWNQSFYSCKNLNDILSEKYFPVFEYKTIIEQRINSITKIENELNSEDKKWEYSDEEILKLLPLYEKELVHYSNNSLEKTLKKKNLYKIIKKNLFSWRGYWSDRTLFYQENLNKKNNYESNNDSIADIINVSKIKYKLINHYTKSFMKPLLVPILDIPYYLPDFSGFDSSKIFNTKNKLVVNMDIDKIVKNKGESKKEEEKKNLKENYLRKIYTNSSPALADKLLKISDSLDFGKEEEFSVFKEEKETKSNSENKDENKDEKEGEKEKLQEKAKKNYFLSCLVKTSHHIKGVCFVDEESLNFKVFLNQKTGNAMSGVNEGFTDKDDDYDNERKTCFGSYFMFHQKDKNLYRISINYKDIKLILLKRYYYKNSALEIFTVTNKSYYFNFKYEEERGIFIDELISKLEDPKQIINDLRDLKDNLNVIGYFVNNQIVRDKRRYTKKENENEKRKAIKLSKTINDWTKWKINNFSFLMWLNFFANRSYNDISQYPVFPWILSNYDDSFKIEPDYSEASLYNSGNDFSQCSSESMNNSSRGASFLSENDDKKKKKKKVEEEYDYRDMKLPMGMLEINEESKKRKDAFIELYNTIKENKDEFEGTKPHFYGTNYSNPIYVCNFLMRLFPFTHISIELQGNKMDNSDRLFLSVVKSFNNSISQKTDVRELIPEFFYLPEMFLNINDVNLGKLEDNSVVYNVKTPCKNNAYSFIEIMKRIFENNRISSTINNWVDLIFGYKVKGKEAEKAKNIYTEPSYQEYVNLNNIEDKGTYLRYVEFGLIPTQIMAKECPKREKKRDIKKEKELTEYTWTNINKIKVTQIKHDASSGKLMKEDGIKSKLLKANILTNDKIISLYDNNIIIESKIGSSSEDISNILKLKDINGKIGKNIFEKISDKIIKFCNLGTTLVMGGFYDGRIEIIYFEEKVEKDRKEIYPFSEEEPILSISISEDETFMILGNSIGNIAIYNIDVEEDNWELYKKIFNQMSRIIDININNDLNLFAIASLDGFVNLYTSPLCKLVRSIRIPINKEDNGKIKYIFLSESSLPSIIVVTEDNKECQIFSYSINGKYLASLKEDKTFNCPLKIKDLNSYEYLAYYSKSQIHVINLPSLSSQILITLEKVSNIKSLCINEDLSVIYCISEDGSEIRAIKD